MMESLKRVYLQFFILVYALYALFNKGIAYSFLSEFVFFTGILLVLFSLREYEFEWDKKMAFLVFFVFVSIVNIPRGIIQGYPIVDVIRDSVIFNYIGFIFIIYFLKNQIEEFKRYLFIVYKWYPLIICFLFLLNSYFPPFRDIKLFGEQYIWLYKFGDLGVHLFISTILLLNGNIQLSGRYLIGQFIVIAYLFLVLSSYSRSGMISFGIPLFIFLIATKNKEIKKQIMGLIKLAPLFVLLALPIFLSTDVKENFQGRKLGIEQLQQNIVSIFTTEKDGTTLSDNKIWRLVWWAKIIDYTFMGEYFMYGRGLGMSLAETDEIIHEETDGVLRSPHSFHLTILARFGVPIFFMWLLFLFWHFKLFWYKNISPMLLVYLTITCAFVINASFDVYLEGPMGAMPFWIFIGLTYLEEQKKENG